MYIVVGVQKTVVRSEIGKYMRMSRQSVNAGVEWWGSGSARVVVRRWSRNETIIKLSEITGLVWRAPQGEKFTELTKYKLQAKRKKSLEKREKEKGKYTTKKDEQRTLSPFFFSPDIERRRESKENITKQTDKGSLQVLRYPWIDKRNTLIEG